jgi:xylose isomerase
MTFAYSKLKLSAETILAGERVVLGKPLKEHPHFAVAYWHSLAMTGTASSLPQEHTR